MNTAQIIIQPVSHLLHFVHFLSENYVA